MLTQLITNIRPCILIDWPRIGNPYVQRIGNAKDGYHAITMMTPTQIKAFRALRYGVIIL